MDLAEGLLSQELGRTKKKSILVAEDSQICLNVIQNQMNELGLANNCEFFLSGDYLFERAVKIYED